MTLAFFQFQSNQVRVVTIKGEPWFVAKDLCAVLEISNSRDAVARLDEDEKGVVTTDTLGGEQELVTVSESGMYSLVLTSRKPQAKIFKRWITHDVVPTIRQTGKYEIEPIAPTEHQLPATYIEALKALVIAEEEKEALMQANALLGVEIEGLEEDVELLSEVVDELFDYSSIIRIAKFNDVSEREFKWRKLKAASQVLKVDVKTAPCPRYGKKNLYSHDAWRLAYPDAKLPETTTLTIARKD